MTEPALRADAEERRRRILDAAAETFSHDGVDVPLDRVARAAGVGVATLYRRFPDRASLVVAVVQRDLADLLDAARHARAEAPTAWAAVEVLLAHPDHALTLRPQLMDVPEMAAAVRDDPGVQALQHQLLALLDDIVTAAQAEGTLRPDVGAGDVALMLSLVRRRAVVRPHAQAGAAARTAALVLAALATGPVTLPGEALGLDALPLAAEADPAVSGG